MIAYRSLPYWFFFSSALNPLGGWTRKGDWILASAETPKRTIGISTKKARSRPVMRAGVSNW
jgi:hypothetical protein